MSIAFKKTSQQCHNCHITTKHQNHITMTSLNYKCQLLSKTVIQTKKKLNPNDFIKNFLFLIKIKS